MKVYRIHECQRFPVDIETAWGFFSDPARLAEITLPSIRFTLTSAVPEAMHAGMILTYRLRPLAGWPMRWLAEITHVDRPCAFVDEQRLGPYRFWHHRHVFRPVDGGVEVEDVIHYALPLGPLGRLVHAVAVRRQLERIFAFRREALAARLGRLGEATP